MSHAWNEWKAFVVSEFALEKVIQNRIFNVIAASPNGMGCSRSLAELQLLIPTEASYALYFCDAYHKRTRWLFLRLFEVLGSY